MSVQKAPMGFIDLGFTFFISSSHPAEHDIVSCRNERG